jgi:hypothetical protein
MMVMNPYTSCTAEETGLTVEFKILNLKMRLFLLIHHSLPVQIVESLWSPLGRLTLYTKTLEPHWSPSRVYIIWTKDLEPQWSPPCYADNIHQVLGAPLESH